MFGHMIITPNSRVAIIHLSSKQFSIMSIDVQQVLEQLDHFKAAKR